MSENNDRHLYEYDVILSGNTAPARVVRMVGKNKRVLEIGAGPGSITKMLKHFGHCRVTGVEIDKESIKKLSPFCERVYELNLNDPSWSAALVKEHPFDVIVGADVLEHVGQPVSVLKSLADIAGKSGEIIISLPHIGHNAIIACLLNEDFQYRDWGLLDRSHIRFFALKNMQQLFQDAGLKIIEAEFVITPPELSEFVETWDALSEELKTVLTKHRHGQVYQVVIKAVSSRHKTPEIDLMDVPVKTLPQEETPSFIRKLARKYLSDQTRYRILKFFRMI